MKALCLAALLLLLAAGGAFADEKPVLIDSGLVAGTLEDGIAVWRGIPYAAPPIGPLRWREPQPVKPWKEVRQATKVSTTCLQASEWDKQPRSEDCLTLSVWAPADYRGKKLPVMVWFHGGGLHSGSGSQPLYYGDQLPRRGVILVTFNYRLGVFGFFSHPELTTESPFHASGNQGQLDQIAALQWVQRNIASFGGDPGQMTIFGESAGSSSVQTLMVSPLTEGLFQAAIGESGGEVRPVTADQKLPAAEQRGVQLAGIVGASSLTALRALPAETLNKQAWKPEPVIDRHFLIEGAGDAYKAHHQRDVPLMVGWNADEGPDMVGDTLKGASAEEFHKTMEWLFAPRPVPALFETRYPSATEEQTKDSIRFMQDGIGYVMWHWASEQRSQSRSAAYAYYFLHSPPEQSTPCTYGCRAGHGAELRFLFGHLDQEQRDWRPQDRQVSDRMITYWTNFAKFHDPNGAGLPNWNRFDGKETSVLRLGTEQEIAERGKFADLPRLEKAIIGTP